MEHEVRETPLKIKSSGIHKLSSDLTVRAWQAILIRADDVDLDLNGYTVRGLPLHPNTPGPLAQPAPIGIYAPGQKNVVVRNGTVTSCWRGFQADENTRALRLD